LAPRDFEWRRFGFGMTVPQGLRSMDVFQSFPPIIDVIRRLFGVTPLYAWKDLVKVLVSIGRCHTPSGYRKCKHLPYVFGDVNGLVVIAKPPNFFIIKLCDASTLFSR
jgi:hypothetical protein